jgi:glycine hydroxymethyltransferase
MNKQIGQFEKLMNDHEDYRNRCLNLTPSENILSPLAKKAIQSDMGQRYFFENAYSPNEGASYSYKGSKYIEKLLDIGHEIANDIFNANYVSLYALSGHQANIALLFAFTKPGDIILCHGPAFGGYPGLDKDKLPKYLSVQVQYFPMMKAIPEMIDVDKTVKLIDQIKPKIIIFSSANTLFPMPIKDIKMAAEKIGSKVVYDGSHPLGLITGNRFQNPLNEGADVLVGGTQKSFPGPQGAIIATNNCVDNIKEIEHFVTVDNPHFHRIAANNMLTKLLIMQNILLNVYRHQVCLYVIENMDLLNHICLRSR